MSGQILAPAAGGPGFVPSVQDAVIHSSPQTLSKSPLPIRTDILAVSTPQRSTQQQQEPVGVETPTLFAPDVAAPPLNSPLDVAMMTPHPLDILAKSRLQYSAATSLEEAAIPTTPMDEVETAYNFQRPPMTSAEAQSLLYLAFGPGLDAELLSRLGQLGHMLPMENLLPPMDMGAAHAPAPLDAISAYARLDFEDGQFYINTYSVILGRDVEAAMKIKRNERLEQARSERLAHPDQTPLHMKRKRSRYTASVVSESGGIVRDFKSDSDAEERRRRRRKKENLLKSKSKSSSTSGDLEASRPHTRRNSISYVPYNDQPQLQKYKDSKAAPVDPKALRPTPYECPILFVHPKDSTVASFKSISKEHILITYNIDRERWEMKVLGRNGAFLNEVFTPYEAVAPLENGSRLLFGEVHLTFSLPDNIINEGAADPANSIQQHYVEDGKEMSFDFDPVQRNPAFMCDTEDESDTAMRKASASEPETATGDFAEDSRAHNGSNHSELAAPNLKSQVDARDAMEKLPAVQLTVEGLQGELPMKRRGPGRPPKNGIMSKREMRELQRAEQDRLSRMVTGDSSSPTPGKLKAGRVKKNLPEEDGNKTEKRKYTKRKPKDLDAVKNEHDSGAEGDGSGRMRSPSLSPPPPESTLTAEQLTKPNSNYVMLIYEAISNYEVNGKKTGCVALPSIYRAIEKKHPYFAYKCGTKGWQSSVRHNLSQHPAFCKVARAGKGWMWAIVEGQSIEKEKKRRATPPPPGLVATQYQPQLYQGPPPHILNGGTPLMGPPPGYMNGPVPPNMNRPYPPLAPGSLPMKGYPMQPSMGYPTGLGPPHLQPLLPPPPGQPAPKYSSPYGPKPQAAPTLTTDAASSSNQSNERPLTAVPSYATSQRLPPIPPPSEASSIAKNQPSYTSFDQPPQQTTSNSTQGELSQPKLPPQALPSLQASHSPPQAPISEQVLRAIETFRTSLVASLKGKSDHAETVVASAINRVLGHTTHSAVPGGDPNEGKIMIALRNVIGKLPGGNFLPPLNVESTPTEKQPPGSPKQAQLTQHAAHVPGHPPIQANGSAPYTPPLSSRHGSPSSKPPAGSTIARPTFASTLQRPSMNATGRSSTNTPTTSRADSGSPAPPRPDINSIQKMPAPASTQEVSGLTVGDVASTTNVAKVDPANPVPKRAVTSSDKEHESSLQQVGIAHTHLQTPTTPLLPMNGQELQQTNLPKALNDTQFPPHLSSQYPHLAQHGLFQPQQMLPQSQLRNLQSNIPVPQGQLGPPSQNLAQLPILNMLPPQQSEPPPQSVQNVSQQPTQSIKQSQPQPQPQPQPQQTHSTPQASEQPARQQAHPITCAPQRPLQRTYSTPPQPSFTPANASPQHLPNEHGKRTLSVSNCESPEESGADYKRQKPAVAPTRVVT